MIVPFLVYLTYRTEFLVFPLVQPAATPSEHNTTFTRSQNLQTLVAAFLLYLSHTCSGFRLQVCRCSLVQFGFPQPFLERCYVTHWLLGEMLRSPQYFSCSLNFYSTSNCFPPDKMSSFAVRLKACWRDFSSGCASRSLSLTLSVNAPFSLALLATRLLLNI